MLDQVQTERLMERKKRAQRKKIIRCVSAVALAVVLVFSAVVIHNFNETTPVDGTNISEQTSSTTQPSTTETTVTETETSTTETTTEESTTEKPETTTKKTTSNKPQAVIRVPAAGSTKVATASVGVTGDILIHKNVLDAAKKSDGTYDFSDAFTKVSPYYKKYDKMIANLEVTLGGEEKGYSSYPMFNTPDSIVTALKNAGVDMLLTSNNHTYDTGYSGMKRTLQVIESMGLEYTGTRLSESAPRFKVSNIDGIKVGMMCYTYETSSSTAGRKALNGLLLSAEAGPLVNSFDYNNLSAFYTDAKNSIAAMKNQGAEAIVFYMHWGNEYQTYTNSYQKKMAQNLCDLGVDVIVGGHPHVIQPFDTLVSENGHETICIYSIGNALSNQRRSLISSAPNGHTEDGMIFTFSFEKWSDGTVLISDVNILPTWVDLKTVNGKKVYDIIPLDASIGDWSTLGLSSVSSGKASYNRTMKIVGEGLNEYRTSHGMTAVKTSI